MKKGENLGLLANKYQVKTADIVRLNNLKRNELWVGETLKIPDNGKNSTPPKSTDEKKNQPNKDIKDEKNKNKAGKKDSKIVEATPQKEDKSAAKKIPDYHVVEKDQTLYAVARQYNLPAARLLKLNPQLKNGKVIAGQKIKLKEK